ncbi:hypothetical protein ACIQUM_15795 [Amycolatopsis azurea]|uniref:hypothetical protein n=1 Tax=Amycolatopsis azurea TaxID=36819 RepID=UPI00380BFE28
MTIQVEWERVSCSVAEVEAALRWLAGCKDGGPLGFLRHAIEDPASESAVVLDALVRPTESMTTATPEVRALAVWGLVLDEISRTGPTGEAADCDILNAAFRLGMPQHNTWWRAVSDQLFRCLARKLDVLARDGEAWRTYVEVAFPEPQASARRMPRCGVQPVFLERQLVNVEMRRRTAYRRLTVRNVVACEDGVDGYRARALTGWTGDLAPMPVKGIFGCRAETRPGAQPGDPLTMDLRFPKPLRKGERHEFVSLACDDDLDEERHWINVEVDHHGIAPCAIDGEGRLTGGLSVSITFDDCVPEACWWYAEQADHERRVRPPAGDRRLLEIRRGVVEHTFPGPCRPREEYGIAFRWPRP